MWNNRPSFFLLIQIRHKERILPLFIPLFVFEDILEALNDLGLIWSRLFPRHTLPAAITASCLELFQELRRCKNDPLVNVQDGENQVLIKFY